MTDTMIDLLRVIAESDDADFRRVRRRAWRAQPKAPHPAQ